MHFFPGASFCVSNVRKLQKLCQVCTLSTKLLFLYPSCYFYLFDHSLTRHRCCSPNILIGGNGQVHMHVMTLLDKFATPTHSCELVMHKINVPKANIVARISPPIFEWYAVRHGCKNIHQNDMCLKEIRLPDESMINHSRLNNQHDWENLYDHLMRKRIFTFIHNHQEIHMCFKMLWGKSWVWAQFGFANHLTLIACYVSYERWVQREKYLKQHTSVP